VESELGSGTTFHIYIPAVIRKKIDKTVGDNDIVKGIGKILLMDDDVNIQDISTELFACLGYTIDTAKNGYEAIDKYKNAMSSGDRYVAIIIDLTIPGGMGGEDCIKKLLDIDPSVKAIVSSGYSNDPIMSEYRRYGFSGVIAKPYRIEELSQLLYKIIHNRVN
jgi:two-component system, cell cycle sensor histidine kinase and response regulator CckA